MHNNPIFLLFLTIVCGALGYVGLNATDNWRVLLPCMIAAFFFCVSLIQPAKRKAKTRQNQNKTQLYTYNLTVLPRPQPVAVTTARLRIWQSLHEKTKAA